MPYNIDELVSLQSQVQDAIYQKGNRYGQIGLASANGFYIPSDERNKRTISVTLENGTIVLADSQRVTPIPGAKVRLRMESGLWVIKGADEREILSKPSNKSVNVAPHNHNVGSAPGMFYPIDPASINDGMLYPTGSGLQCAVGRVMYPTPNGSLNVYDSAGTLDFAAAESGLDADESRWSIAYILRTDGSVNRFDATIGTAPLNTTTDLDAAIDECLQDTLAAFPFHAVRIKAGVTTFATYHPMVGANVGDKTFLRLGYVAPQLTDKSIYATKTSNYAITASDGTILVDASGGDVTITLPDVATVDGQVFTIKAMDISGGTASIATTSSQTIDGDTSFDFLSQYDVVRLQSVGTEWVII